MPQTGRVAATNYSGNKSCLHTLMNFKIYTLLFFSFFVPATLLAQMDAYPGVWQMEYTTGQQVSPVHIELHIASPERNILYPSHLVLQCGDFNAEYNLLLVRKNSRELGISKNKYPLYEKPFSLGKTTFLLNGTFDFSRGGKGQPTLNINRIQSKQNIGAVIDSMHFGKDEKAIASALINFLNSAEISLSKTSSIPWKADEDANMLSPSYSQAYFGLLDTVYLPVKDGFLHISGSKKDDVVSVASNGGVLVDMQAITKKTYTQDVVLDTGLTIMVLFADNFANDLPNKGRMQLEFGTKKFSLDFANSADSAATFIIAKLYYVKDKDKENSFKDYAPSGDDKIIKPNEKLIGSITSASRQVTLALWDDAVEDGDSVTITINGNKIVQGFLVKKRPQFINVTLKPGPNNITFSADNLGSIPPNTSVLEIIDGKRRRSFMLETTLEQNNLLKIFYDLH